MAVNFCHRSKGRTTVSIGLVWWLFLNGCGPSGLIPPRTRATVHKSFQNVVVMLDGGSVTNDATRVSNGDKLQVEGSFKMVPEPDISLGKTVEFGWYIHSTKFPRGISCGNGEGIPIQQVDDGTFKFNGSIETLQEPGLYELRMRIPARRPHYPDEQRIVGCPIIRIR